MVDHRRAAAIAGALLALCLAVSPSAIAQPAAGRVRGRVTDETGGALPGVTVELRSMRGDADGRRHQRRPATIRSTTSRPGTYQVSFTLINFALDDPS